MNKHYTTHFARRYRYRGPEVFAGVNVRFMRDNNINGYTLLLFANALRARIAGTTDK